MMHATGQILPSDSDSHFQTMKTAHWMAESTSHVDDVKLIEHHSCILPAQLVVVISQAIPLCMTRLNCTHMVMLIRANTHQQFGASEHTDWEKRQMGADTSAVRVIPAASSLLSHPLCCSLHLSREQAAAWVSLVPAAGISAPIRFKLQGDPFHHSAFGLVKLPG